MLPNLRAPDARVRRLERQYSRLRVIAIGSLLPWAVAALGAFQKSGGEAVRTDRVELMDGEGRPRAVLSADSLGFAVMLLDGQGRPTGSLRLSDEPRLAVETGRGREVAGLGAPKLHNLTE